MSKIKFNKIKKAYDETHENITAGWTYNEAITKFHEMVGDFLKENDVYKCPKCGSDDETGLSPENPTPQVVCYCCGEMFDEPGV